jgi:Fe-S-cluster containining protein
MTTMPTKLPCRLCAKCCEQTQMLLSNADLERIERETKQARRQFSYLKDGYFYLKNRGQYCIFLNPAANKCSIYDIRPQGCRFYPIIFDPISNCAVVDKDCTNRDNIPQDLTLENLPELREFILLLEKERSIRLNLNSKEKGK